MKKYFLILGLLLVKLSLMAQNCQCDSLFLQTQKIVEDNYAGWFDRLNSGTYANYKAWTKKQYHVAKTIQSDSLCAKQLQVWIAYFEDRHLQIKYQRAIITDPIYQSKNEILILKGALNKEQINHYLKTNKTLDPIEGIYENDSYTLGMVEVEPNLFHAIIMHTENENWNIGEVKLSVRKTGDAYEGTFYEGDKSDMSTHKVQLVDNILDFDIVFFEKAFPVPTIKRDMVAYEVSKDIYAPSLKFIEDVAVWKFPSFENNTYQQTKFLLNKYKEKLATIPYWILDLSDNSGGDYRVGMQLFSYIYTKPIIQYRSEMRMTESNLERWYQEFIASYYENTDNETQKKLDVRMDLMKANYGKMYNEKGTMCDTLVLDTIKPFPQKIALLINNQTVSSGELFTILARQSDKVTVMGEKSGGMIDYANIVNYKTSCSSIKIQLPLSRQLWLDNGISIDKDKITPEVYLKGDDWSSQAINLLRK